MNTAPADTFLLHVLVERHAFIQTNGDVDDILSIELRNCGTSAYSFNCLLRFEYTDTKTEFICARDKGGTWIPYYEEAIAEREELLIQPKQEEIPPGGRRILAVKVRRLGLADTTTGILSFSDPLYAMAFPELAPKRITYRATVIFPKNNFPRALLPQGATKATSRTATWVWNEALGMGKYLKMRVRQDRAVLPSAPRNLDDAIAEAHRLLVSCILGEPLELDQLRTHLADTSGFTLSDHASLPDNVSFEKLEQAAREVHLRELLEQLHRVRVDVVNSTEYPVGTTFAVEALAEWLARKIERAIELAAVHTPMPQDAATALVALLQYQNFQRATPTKWSKSLDEKDFQQRFQEFLGARGITNVKEVSTAGGRMDFLVGTTPVELKVRNLKGNPAVELRHHLQQAAEYAAANGWGLGFLLVLDEHPYAPRGPHLPPPNELVYVEAVPSAPGVAGPSHTLVASIVVPAYPPEPSAMAAVAKPPRRPKVSPR